jgi:hypothetical protein
MSEYFIDGAFTNIGLPFGSPPSVNRDKYSKPEDVLFSESGQFDGWGVLAFVVAEFPGPVSASNCQYLLVPRHVPLEENYAHSEIWCNKVPGTTEHVDAPKTVKKLYRAQLSQRVRVLIPTSK